MDLKKFEEITRRAGAKPIEQFEYRDSKVYIADGISPLESSEGIMSYRTIVAVGGTRNSGDNLVLAEPIYFKMSLPQNRILSNRLNKARERGKFLVDTFRTVEAQRGKSK